MVGHHDHEGPARGAGGVERVEDRPELVVDPRDLAFVEREGVLEIALADRAQQSSGVLRIGSADRRAAHAPAAGEGAPA